MRQERRFVSALDDAARLGQLRLASLAQLRLVLTFGGIHLASLASERAQAFGDLRRVDARHRALPPDWFQFAQSLLRNPEAVGHDDDGVIEFQNAAHAAMAHRRRLVDAFERSL